MRGATTLATTLMVGAVGILLAFSLGAAALHQLGVSSRLGDQQTARNLAESVVARATEKLLYDPDYGKPGSAGDPIYWSVPGMPGEAVLAFDPGQAEQLGIPPSTNNFGKDAPAAGWERQVPVNSGQLIGTATCNGVTRHVEVVLHVPSYPFVVGSSGPIQTEGHVLVGRVTPGTVDPTRLQPGQLLPGAIGSNSQDADQALDLSSFTRVTGDARAAGGVKLETGAVVDGQVRSQAPPAALPELAVGDYDPIKRGYTNVQTLATVNPGETLSGPLVHHGDLTLDGGLKLDGAWLYVDGDLTLSGGLQGKGGVFVTGKTRLGDGVDLSADNQVALLSKGDFTLTGKAQNASYFRGLIYTEGSFSARDITLVGDFVANCREPGGSRVHVEEANVLQDSGPVSVSLTPPTGGAAPSHSFGGSVSMPGKTGTLSTMDFDWTGPARAFTGQAQPGDQLQLLCTGHQGGQTTNLGTLSMTFNGTNYEGVFQNQPFTMTLTALASGGFSISFQSATLTYWQDCTGGQASTPITQTGPGNPGPVGWAPLNLDFNQFISFADKVRVLQWREW